jgi:hypothetical protein
MMTFALDREEGCAVARLEGLAMLEGWMEMLPGLGEATTDVPGGCLLIDLHGLVGFLGTPERRRVGELAAVHLKHLRRVALLVPPQKVTGVTEAAARAAGLDLRVFADGQQARDWLLES